MTRKGGTLLKPHELDDIDLYARRTLIRHRTGSMAAYDMTCGCFECETIRKYVRPLLDHIEAAADPASNSEAGNINTSPDTAE